MATLPRLAGRPPAQRPRDRGPALRHQTRPAPRHEEVADEHGRGPCRAGRGNPCLAQDQWQEPERQRDHQRARPTPHACAVRAGNTQCRSLPSGCWTECQSTMAPGLGVAVRTTWASLHSAKRLQVARSSTGSAQGVPSGHYRSLDAETHQFDDAHRQYSRVVAEVVDRWIKRNGIDPKQMTAAQARALLGYVLSHRHPVIRGYHEMLAKSAALKAARRAKGID